MPTDYLRDFVTYWRTEFDWRAQERRINAFPQFVTEIDGQTVHFVHVRSAEPNATPLVLTHTYPGSFVDLLDMVGPLTDPVAHGGRAEDAFSVVIPSIPGFTFSMPLVDRGWTMARVARTWDVLMRRLGYDSYGTHGSDAGAMVSRELALLNPDGFLGAHVLQLFSFPSGDPAEFEKMTPEGLRGARVRRLVPRSRRVLRDARVTPADRRRMRWPTRRPASWPGTNCSSPSAREACSPATRS